MMSSFSSNFGSQVPTPYVSFVVVFYRRRCSLQRLIFCLRLLGGADNIQKTCSEAQDDQNDHQPGRRAELPIERPAEPAADNNADNQLSGELESSPEIGGLASLVHRPLSLCPLRFKRIELVAKFF